MKKGTVVTAAPVKATGLSLKDAKWISPQPKVIEVNEATLPNTERYLVIPKSAPHLQSHIRAGVWNVLDKSITLAIRETKDLFVMEWLASVNTRHKAAAKSPFPDFECDQLAVVFLSGQGTRIIGMKLKGIELVAHTTSFGGEPKNLTHEVVFKYDETEKLKFTSEDTPPLSNNEKADEEWAEVILEPQTK